MAIRTACKQDALQIRELLRALGYEEVEGLFENKLSRLLDDKHQIIMVHDNGAGIDGLLTVQVSQTLGPGELALVFYYALGRAGARTLESCGLGLAMGKSCGWIQVYGVTRRSGIWRIRGRNRLRQLLMRGLEYPEY